MRQPSKCFSYRIIESVHTKDVQLIRSLTSLTLDSHIAAIEFLLLKNEQCEWVALLTCTCEYYRLWINERLCVIFVGFVRCFVVRLMHIAHILHIERRKKTLNDVDIVQVFVPWADFACHLIPGRRYDLCTSFVWHLTYTSNEHCWRLFCHSLFTCQLDLVHFL